jgi:hypothetical protein
MVGDQQDPGLLRRSLDSIFNSIMHQQANRCVCLKQLIFQSEIIII